MSTTKMIVKIILSAGFAAAIVFFLFQQAGFRDIKTITKLIDMKFVVAAFLVYFATNLVRAFRFNLILNKEIGFFKFTNIVSLQNFFNMILPFRIGEASYFYLVNKNSSASLAKSIASLVGVRFLDLISVLIISVISLTLLLKDGLNLTFLVFPAVIALAAASSLFLIIIFIPLSFLDIILRKSMTGGFFNRSIFKVILEKLRETFLALAEFRRKSLFFKVVILSFAATLMNFMIANLLIKSLGMKLNFIEVVFVYTFPMIVGLLPTSILGGVGFYEGSLSYALVLLGVDRERAIASSFILHAQDIILIVILAIIGYFGLRLFKSKNAL